MSQFLETGIRTIGFDLEDEAIQELREMWMEYIKSIPPYPTNQYDGTGIVMCAGGLSYFTCAWVCVNNLRQMGCTLPVELWYLGDELSDEVIMHLNALNVECKDFLESNSTLLSGVSLKPLAILRSRFKHVLFLDADNNCLRNPEYLFDTTQYMKYGAIFWPDFWKTDMHNPVWKIVDSEFYDEYEQESGQLIVNKEVCWKALNLALYFNEKSEYYYKLLFGDKDTFRFAWQALKQDYFMIDTPVACCGYHEQNKFYGMTMLQYDFIGEPLFLHRNLIKWDITKPNEINLWTMIKRFVKDANDKIYTLSFNNLNRHQYLDLDGDIESFAVDDSIIELEVRCLSILKTLRGQSFYGRYALERFIIEKRGV
ncbi:MAG: hypothetical protein ACTHYC_13400 [Sphingobacterium sp.]